jgi:hypothetical protein
MEGQDLFVLFRRIAMRTAPALLALMVISAPVAAQPASPAQGVANSDPSADIARRIADPALADKLAGAMQALGKAFLELPVGEVQAALEGRPATGADKRVTVRDLGRRDDPQFDRKFAAQLANARPMMEQSFKAMGQALPAITQSLRQAGEALERAAANMPDPAYPRR